LSRKWWGRFQRAVAMLAAVMTAVVVAVIFVQVGDSGPEPKESDDARAAEPDVVARSAQVQTARSSIDSHVPAVPEVSDRADSPPSRSNLMAAFAAQDSSDPESVSNRLRSALRASGPSAERWTAEARDAIAAWPEIETPGGRVALSDVECYQDGCLVTADYPDSKSVDKAWESISESDSFHAWPGGKMAGPRVFTTNGRVWNHWIMLRPVGN
jgi:hypothetical protein